VAVFVVVVVV